MRYASRSPSGHRARRRGGHCRGSRGRTRRNALLAAIEAGADPRYVEALVVANAEDTLITDRFAPPGVPLRARALRAAIEIGEPFYAGESTGAVRRVQPVGEIVRELAEGAERLLVQGARRVEPAFEPPAG